MLRKLMVLGNTLILTVSIAAAADTAQARANLSASDIVARNVAARGGLQAWRAVQTMSFAGKLGAGGNQRAPLPLPVPGKHNAKLPVQPRPEEEVQLPFVMKMQRPRKVRIELEFNHQEALQVFDGVSGWKLRPYLNRRLVEPYTAEELKGASLQSEIDGPLVDYAAKGTRIELAGLEKVEDRDTFKLKLTFKNGTTTSVWIDAQTFLEAKILGQPRRLDGKEHAVEIYYRDYRSVSGLQIPFVLETKVLPLEDPDRRMKDPSVPVEKVTIEKVAVNPKLDASLFAKPQIESAANHP